jgi:hypothetical protein
MTDDSSGADTGHVRLLGSGVLREAARAPDSYGLVLGLVFIDYVLLSVSFTGRLAPIVQAFFIGLTALIGFRTSRIRGRMLLAVRIAVAMAVASAIVAAILGPSVKRADGIVFVILALLVLTTPIAIISRIMKHSKVTTETILGAISVYVLLGIVFSYLDLAVQQAGGHPFFAQSGTHTPPDFVYFSFITMTTVGYGDLTPTTGLPRTMAVTEALVGQIFLVVLVSRLVAMYTPQSGRSRIQALRAADAADRGEAVHPGTAVDPEVIVADDGENPFLGERDDTTGRADPSVE